MNGVHVPRTRSRSDRGTPGREQQDPHATEVLLVGGFQVRVGGATVELPSGGQRLVALLALLGRCSRSRVAGSLWPDSSEERALASLRTVLWRLNQVAPRLVASSGGPLRLAPEVDVDVDRFQRAAARMMRAPAEYTGWEELVGVGGELLADWPDEWLLPHRERLHQMQLHVLEAAAEGLSAQGRYGLALEAALAALHADPLRESAHRSVMRVHVAEGNLAEAWRAYSACRRLLQRELGVDPSPQTTRVLGTRGSLALAH